MNFIELFAGGRSFGRTAESMGHNVFSSDYKPFDGIHYVTDIMDFDPSKVPFEKVHGIWASPPCEKFSIKTAVKGGGNQSYETIKENGRVVSIKPRTNFNIDSKFMRFPVKINEERIKHEGYVEKTLELIRIFNPDFFFIENPASGFMKFYLKDHPMYHNYTTYCQYGFDYMKRTNVFSNIPLNLKSCKNGDDCHTDTFSQRWDHKKQTHEMKALTYYDRSLIPEGLIRDILEQTMYHNQI